MTRRESFWVNTRRLDNGCLIWTGPKFKNGYGYFTTTDPLSGPKRRAKVLAHRFAFEEQVRPLLPREKVDHDCHNRDDSCDGGWECPHRPCVEPTHLVGSTQRQNLLMSSLTLPAIYAARDACKWDHEFTPENTRWRGNTRECRECCRLRQAKVRERRRAARSKH